MLCQQIKFGYAITGVKPSATHLSLWKRGFSPYGDVRVGAARPQNKGNLDTTL
jgi:hypothetical protein